MAIDPKDDKIKSAEDLRKLLDDAGLPNVPIFEVEDIDHPKSEELKTIVDAIRKYGDGTSQA